MSAPKGLQASGRALWRSVTGFEDGSGRVLELRPDELSSLESACRTLDELRALEAALAGVEELMVPGSAGQIRPHPLFAEVRAHRATLIACLKSIGLGEAESQGLSRSAAGRALVRHRWGQAG